MPSGVSLNNFKESKNNRQDELIGKVTDNKDMPKGLPGYVAPTSDGAPVHDDGKRPTLGIGRLKISIPGLTDSIPDIDKPWTNIHSNLGSGTGAGIGKFIVPAVGTYVTLKRIGYGEYDYIVTGEYNSTKKKKTDYEENYPETWGSRDKIGNKSVINMKTHRSFFEHVSKTSLEIIKSGTANVLVKDDLNVHVIDNTTDKYDGWHNETIGEYRKTDIGQYVNEKIGTYFDGTYGTTYKESIGSSYTGTFGTSYSESIGGNYTGTVGGSSSYSVSGTINEYASNINLYTSLVTIYGNLSVTGNIFAMGSISIPGTSLGTHIHGGVKSGPSVTTPGFG